MRITRSQLITLGVAILSTTLAYAINYELSLGPLNGDKPAGPVIAASLVGIIAALFFKGYAVAGYIAAFAGMSSKTVIPSLIYAPIFGLAAGIFAILFAKLFVGYGGKAGTTCFCSVNLTLALMATLGLLGLSQASITTYFRPLVTSDLDPTWIASAILAGVYGIVATVLFREKVLQKHKAPNESVLGSAVIALTSAFVMPWVAPSLAGKLSAVVASGTYAGMVSRKIVASTWHIVVAGVLLGLLNVVLASVFIGIGGKLGFIGLLSTAVFHYLEVKGLKTQSARALYSR